jgi:hypothetical protein
MTADPLSPQERKLIKLVARELPKYYWVRSFLEGRETPADIETAKAWLASQDKL